MKKKGVDNIEHVVIADFMILLIFNPGQKLCVSSKLKYRFLLVQKYEQRALIPA